jgi:hypothetical protein
METETLEDSLGRLEHDCGLPNGFCLALLQESDWSFVIKLHALLETAVSQLLVHSLGRRELADTFASLEMSNTKTGKLAFVNALRLLPKAQIEFIRALSELRNQLVHRVKNVSFNLTEHFSAERRKRSTADARKVADKWGFALRDGDKPDEPVTRYHYNVRDSRSGTLESREKTFFFIPKHVMLISAMAILDAISMINRYGAHIWKFLMDCEDRAEFIKKAEEIFAKAKVGDREHPFQIKEALERNNSVLKVKLDDDGQPILESLAGALYAEHQRRAALELLDSLIKKQQDERAPKS